MPPDSRSESATIPTRGRRRWLHGGRLAPRVGFALWWQAPAALCPPTRGASRPPSRAVVAGAVMLADSRSASATIPCQDHLPHPSRQWVTRLPGPGGILLLGG